MFQSFFPNPKLYFSSAAVWALFCVLGWYLVVQDWGPSFSQGSLLGVEFPAELAEDADDAAKATFEESEKHATQIWFYQYMVVCYILFTLFWLVFSPHKWARWSVVGSSIIIFIVWFQVHVDVLINSWFGEFYDLIQTALATPDAITADQFYGTWIFFAKLAFISVTVSVLNQFFVSHYVFRWRTAMNDYYTDRWAQLRHIEGASQRVQEDTQRFAGIVEGLGVRLIDSVMTLIAFLPILWGLSVHVKSIPILGAIPHALVWIAVGWALFGTGIVALAGIKLPGLQFRNQRVEAAYRKELVIGEDDENRAQPPTLAHLFSHVRKNYFNLYFAYMYFNVFRYGYFQLSVFVPYFALAPTIVAGGITLGVMQQTLRAFNRVESSFQFLVHSWSTIVELMSIYKRLAAFEAIIDGKPLPQIDEDYLKQF